MSKSAEVELTQLKHAVSCLVGLLDEGSLVDGYDKNTWEEIASVLQMLLSKVGDLPDTIPKHRVQAAAVRSIIAAKEKHAEIHLPEEKEILGGHMRQIEAVAVFRDIPWANGNESKVPISNIKQLAGIATEWFTSVTSALIIC